MKTKTNLNEGFYNPWEFWNCAKIPMALVADPTITTQAKVIYGVLALHARAEGYCWIGQDTLAEKIGLDISTVKRRIRELLKAEWLHCDRRGQGMTNVYYFPMPKAFERVLPAPTTGQACPPEGGTGAPSEGAQVPLPYSEDTKLKTRKEDTHGEVAAVVDFWNSHSELPKVRSVGGKRRKAVNARLKDDFFAANWREAIAKILASDFCMGKGDKGWQADFDWFTRPDTVTRLMEGRYDNRGKRRAGDAGTLKGGDAYVKRLNIVGGGE